MMKLHRLKLITLVFFSALVVSIAVVALKPAYSSPRLGVFSWNSEDAADENKAKEMLDLLAQLGANEVYQNINSINAISFLRQANEHEIDVYILAGQPEWGLDRDGKQMLKEVDLAAELMNLLGTAGPSGLILDVEPYLTDAYKKNPDRSMRKYLEAMRKTYAYAQESGVPLIICIPYFYDTKGYVDILRALIEESSDAVAVMNYQKADEIGQVETEMAFSKQADKRLIHIFELQRPGLHDLTERNTYYLDGLQAVKDSLERLHAHFYYEGLSFALHDYTALRKVIANE